MAKSNQRADAQAFLGAIQNGGYRPNRYRVTLEGDLPFIENVTDGMRSFSFLAVSAQVPQSTMGVCEAHYFGRPIKMAGDRTFEDWTVEVYTDSNYNTRNLLEQWHDRVLGTETNLAASGYQKPETYYVDAYVDLLDRENNIITTYKMSQIFPNNVGEIALSYETNNTIARFPVTFSVNYWTRVEDYTNAGAGVRFNNLSGGGNAEGRQAGLGVLRPDYLGGN